MIITAGTNLREIMVLPEVDTSRTISNDIFEVEELLGIEVARAVIITESVKAIAGNPFPTNSAARCEDSAADPPFPKIRNGLVLGSVGEE